MRRLSRRWSPRRAAPPLARSRIDRRERAARFRINMSDTTASRLTDPPDDPSACSPSGSPDGIRWDLVNRMKRMISDGQLDTPERWALAEEMLFRATAERR